MSVAPLVGRDAILTASFHPTAAEKILEQLRFGIPPAEHIRLFTVGREEQLSALEQTLHGHEGHGALLVKANYGAGKSHLLQVIRRMALDAGYAVSLVVVDAQGGVRFNRMDTILGAVAKRIEVDGASRIGIGALFDAFSCLPAGNPDTEDQRQRRRETMKTAREEISSRGKWYQTKLLRSPAVHVALRAWTVCQSPDVRNLIEDWLGNPSNYRGQQRGLHQALVRGLWGKFWGDARREREYFDQGVFYFHLNDYQQAWAALADFHLLARAAGLRGLVLLFDEFEDVVQNLKRRDLQEQAFLNLFRFLDGNRYPGMSYFAVTPDFVAKCVLELVRRGAHDFDYEGFARLASFEMDQVTADQFFSLGTRIRAVHAAAYDWDAERYISDADLRQTVNGLWSSASPERVRRAIQQMVRVLDEGLDGV